MRVLRGSVHDEKQRTENGALGNTKEEVCKDEKVLLHLIWKKEDDK